MGSGLKIDDSVVAVKFVTFFFSYNLFPEPQQTHTKTNAVARGYFWRAFCILFRLSEKSAGRPGFTPLVETSRMAS